ncbi:hypothetical protein RUM43_002886 [Polyplax serrata]|uniref:Uncharacterized protein n=1 Tax=Polyplax serrata TaxID=468196 RepID=A0AAN8NUB3_POLSC
MVRLILLPIFLLVSSTIARCPALSIPPRARLAHLSSSEGNVSFEWNFPYQPTTEETERRNPVSCCNGTIDTRNTSQNSTESDVPMVVDNEGHHQPCVNRSIKKLLSERNYSVKTQHFLPASHPLEEPKSNLNSPEEENWMEKPKVNSLHKSYIYLGPQIYPFSFKESRVVVSKSDRRSRIQSSDGTEEKPPVKTCECDRPK